MRAYRPYMKNGYIAVSAGTGDCRYARHDPNRDDPRTAQSVLMRLHYPLEVMLVCIPLVRSLPVELSPFGGNDAGTRGLC
jgi:hypothetical protein